MIKVGKLFLLMSRKVVEFFSDLIQGLSNSMVKPSCKPDLNFDVFQMLIG